MGLLSFIKEAGEKLFRQGQRAGRDGASKGRSSIGREGEGRQ